MSAYTDVITAHGASLSLYVLSNSSGTDLSSYARGGVTYTAGSQTYSEPALGPGLGTSVRFSNGPIGGWGTSVFNTQTTWAVELWVKQSTYVYKGTIFSKNDSDAGYPVIPVFAWQYAARSYISSKTDGTVGQDDGPGIATPTDGPHHLVWVKDTTGSGVTTLKAYLDGVLYSTAGQAFTTNSGAFYIGGIRGGFWADYNGWISDVAVYNGDLGPLPTSMDWYDHYQAGINTQTAYLTGAWRNWRKSGSKSAMVMG